jgi:hypothetical protein
MTVSERNDSERPVSVVLRYATAIAAVGITIALKLAVDGLGEDHPFVLLPAPIAIAAWYGGRGPGIVAAGLVTAAAAFFISWPHPSTDSGDILAVTGMAAEGTLVVWITVGLREARRRAERSVVAADTARRELGFAVAVRDEVLRIWTQRVRGPLTRLEVTATEALAALEHEGYRGSAVGPLHSIADEAAVLRRVTASWSEPSVPPESDET